MTGRGRPRKSKSPDGKCVKRKTGPVEIKRAPLPRCPDFTEEKQNETTKKSKRREQKKPNDTEEKPPAQSTGDGDTKNHFPEEINKQQKTATDSPKVPAQGTKAKTVAARTKATQQRAEEIRTQPDSPKGTTKVKSCGGKAKPVDQVLEGITEMHPETPKDTTKATMKTAKAKACCGKTKTQVQCAEEMESEQLAEKMAKTQPKDATKPSGTTTKAKICAGKGKSPEEHTKIQPETLEEATKVRLKAKATVDYMLHKTLETLTIKRDDKSKAAKVINEIIANIIKHLKQTQCFKQVAQPLHTGSYYENLKISKPDEFDVMLPMPVERVDIKEFGNDGAFYSVALKRGNNPLKKFAEGDILSASKMLEEFRDEVKKCVKGFKEWEVTKKKKGCPAVTLNTQLAAVTISLDVVLCLVVKSSWPSFTNEGLKIEGWLGGKVKKECKREPYYLVPKYEGRGTVETGGVLTKDVWRISFSHTEKAILMNHGSDKTCCEKDGAACCRKDCLKLLKHLLHLLKEKNPSFDKFCSYHAKTTLLHACCSRTKDGDWRASNLSHCFQQLLEDFERHLESGQLQNFFIPSQNLLSGASKTMCKMLAEHIKGERKTGFPIFEQQLPNTHEENKKAN